MPQASDLLWRVPRVANFKLMSTQYVVTVEWIMEHFRRKRTDVLVAPHMTVSVVDDPMHPSHRFNEELWKRFLRKLVLSSKRMGVAAFVYEHRRDRWAHAFVCLFEVTKSRVDVYFIDPNGRQSAFGRLLGPAFAYLRQAVVRLIHSWVLKPARLSADYKAVRTMILDTPDMNAGKTKDMYARDARLGLQGLKDMDGGFCQPWTYVLMLDMLCAPQAALTRNHFTRIWQQAGGTSGSEAAREHSRLMFLRAVLTWLVEHMFDPRHALYAKTRARWGGPDAPLPFVPGFAPLYDYRVPRDNAA